MPERAKKAGFLRKILYYIKLCTYGTNPIVQEVYMIKAENLTMFYGKVQALDNASFEVKKGEIVGLLGPNGAGKSTAIKILTTYLYPTSGKASIGGKDVLDDPLAVRKLIGYLPEVLPLYMDMEVRDYLLFVGKARGMSGAELKSRMEWVVEKCGLKPMFRKLIQDLSRGYKQRTALAQALLHDPEVVILDEPTTGLDPHQIVGVRDLIHELAQDKTVILSTHILHEVEAMSDRIVIINRGRIVGDGTLEQLRNRTKGSNIIQVGVAGDKEDVRKGLSSIAEATGVNYIGTENGVCTFEIQAKDRDTVSRRIGDVVKERNWQISELTEKPYSLEKVFLTLTRAEKNENAKGGAA